MKQIQFFALKEDLLPVLEAVEREGALKYIRTGNRLSADFETFLHGGDIPNLGKATRESAISCDTFLVTDVTQPVRVREIRGSGGVPRYCMDQLINAETVTLTPAGVWNEDVSLCGRVATVSDSAVAQALMKRFNSAFRSHFSKIKAYRVGRGARALLDAGKRLTIAEQSSGSVDLTIMP